MIGQTLLLRGHLCTNDAYKQYSCRMFEYVCGIIFFLTRSFASDDLKTSRQTLWRLKVIKEINC